MKTVWKNVNVFLRRWPWTNFQVCERSLGGTVPLGRTVSQPIFDCIAVPIHASIFPSKENYFFLSAVLFVNQKSCSRLPTAFPSTRADARSCYYAEQRLLLTYLAVSFSPWCAKFKQIYTTNCYKRGTMVPHRNCVCCKKWHLWHFRTRMLQSRFPRATLSESQDFDECRCLSSPQSFSDHNNTSWLQMTILAKGCMWQASQVHVSKLEAACHE